MRDKVTGARRWVVKIGSALLTALFGEENGAPSRSAIGVNVLPGNIPVETEALFELVDDQIPD